MSRATASPGRLINAATAPPATALFADVDYLMVPTMVGCPYSNSRILCEARDFLLTTYGDFIDEYFRLLNENADWRLLERIRSDFAPDAFGASPAFSPNLPVGEPPAATWITWAMSPATSFTFVGQLPSAHQSVRPVIGHSTLLQREVR